jgi:sigma-B regulation protein RsbU (phosphoserine phosphatase)
MTMDRGVSERERGGGFIREHDAAPDGRRVEVLTRLARDLSSADDPRRIVELFVSAMRAAYGPSCYVSLSVKGLERGAYRVVRFMTYDGEELVEAAEVMAARDAEAPAHPVRRGGFFGTLIESDEPKLFNGLCILEDPIAGRSLAEYGSAIAAPVFEEGVIVSWTVLLRRGAEEFSLSSLEQGVLRVNLVGAAATQVRTTRRLREAQREMDREVEAIAEIQRSLLPPRNPRIPGLAIEASYETFDRAGGDYYAFIPVRDIGAGAKDLTGPWALFIADVSGHGPSAAVIASMMHSILHARPFDYAGPADALEQLNRTLFERPLGAAFVTAFLAVYEPSTRAFRYARAGHPPPVLKVRGHGGAVRVLDDVGGLPLGVSSEVGSEESALGLESGQTLVLYTDGITEAAGPGGRQFGLGGVERTLVECSGEPACVLTSLGTALKEHQRGARPSDDQTILALAVV